MAATRPTPIAIVRSLVDVTIVGLVAVVVLAVVLGRIVPLSGRQSLIIAGPSMEPTLPLGSAVVTERVAAHAIEVGDIVAVRNGERAVFTHRVVRTLELHGQPFLETKGDNNPTPDGATVPAAAVIGRVTAYLPFMGYVLAWLSVPSGVVSVLGLGALLIVAALVLETLESDRRRSWLASLTVGLVAGGGLSRTASMPGAVKRIRSKAALATVAAEVVPAAVLAALVDGRSRRPELGITGPPPRARRKRRTGSVSA